MRADAAHLLSATLKLCNASVAMFEVVLEPGDVLFEESRIAVRELGLSGPPSGLLLLVGIAAAWLWHVLDLVILRILAGFLHRRQTTGFGIATDLEALAGYCRKSEPGSLG